MAPLRGRRAREYPPLLVAAAAAVVLLAVLPSSLNLPQENPTETVELAPVPPSEDDPPPPPSGNFASLGLGSSGSLESGTIEGEPPPVEEGSGRAVKTPSTKRCVGNPPRQTEDVSAPPCVASFTGDNGGATYPGVTKDEVRILLHVEGQYNDVGSRGIVARPDGQVFDLAKPSDDPENESYWIEAGRIWQRWFNERFQTYGRFAHFYVSFGRGTSPEARRADAAADFERVRPFATVVQDAPYMSSVPYVEVMARKGVLSFGIRSQLPGTLYEQFAPRLWTYWPSQERQLEQFTDYVCTRIVPYPVSFAGNDEDADPRLGNGAPRRLGLLYVDNASQAAKKRFALLAKKRIEGCGGKFVAEGTYPSSGFFCCSTANNQAAVQNMTRFKSEGVTTIIWPQGYSPEQSQAAGKAAYYPEWVLAGDRQQEELVTSKYQDPSVWDHAMVVTNVPMTGPLRTQLCYQAIREVAPDHPQTDFAIPCRLYEDLRQLFTGIQVAGPRLTPRSLEKGFRAIPNRPSGSPTIPACFYAERDFTCVKDSVAQYWDSTATSTYSSSSGCYRMPQQGRRYLVGEWPRANASADWDRSKDPCNGYTSGQTADPSPGPDAPIPQ